MLAFFLWALLSVLAACKDGRERGESEGREIPESERRRLQEELKQDPSSLGARLSLSELQERESDLPAAVRTLREGIAMDSGATLLWNRLASLLLASGDTTGALSAMEASLRAAPAQADLMLEAGFIHAARNDSKALRMADSVLRMPGATGMHTMAMYLKGVYFGNMGQTAKAIAQYDECIGSDFNFSDAYIEKGILQLEAGRAEEALLTFEKALLVANTDADVYYWKGRCLESLGRLEDASDHYAKALGLDDGLNAAREGIERLRPSLKGRRNTEWSNTSNSD